MDFGFKNNLLGLGILGILIVFDFGKFLKNHSNFKNPYLRRNCKNPTRCAFERDLPKRAVATVLGVDFGDF